MKIEKILLIIIVVFSACYLLPQVFPAVHVGDSGELIASAKILGIAHPPGYPLFSILNKVFFIFPSENPGYRLNMAQAIFGCFVILVLFLIVRKITKRNISAMIFAALFLLAGRVFIVQATVAEVFMLNLLFILLVIYAVMHGKYSVAGLIAGVGLGNQHTLVLIFPAILYYTITENDRKFEKILNFSLWLFIGLSVYLYLPLRAAASPGINWGNSVNITNFISVVTRRAYGTFSLHGSSSAFSLKKGLIILIYFFKYFIRTLTIPGFIVCILGMYKILKEDNRRGMIVLLYFIFSGPVFFLMTNTDINSAGKSILERFFLLPYSALIIGSAGIFYFKGKIKYAAYIIPSFFLISNFTPGSSKPTPLYNYINDIVTTISPDDTLYVQKGGVGDDIVFALVYLKWAEGRLQNIDIYSEYGSIFKKPVSVQGKAAFATFSPEFAKNRLYHTGLLFKNYPQKVLFSKYIGIKNVSGLDYRQRNIAVIYPFFNGWQYFTLGRILEGEQELEKALKIGKDIPWLLNNIGNLYLSAGLFDKAFQYYKNAIETSPGLAEGYNNIANIYFNKAEYEEAVEYYKKAININPDATRYYNLGLTYLTLKDYVSSEDSFIKALEYDPGYVNAYNDLGLVYYRTDKPEKAVGVFEKGLKIDSENTNIIYNIALALEKINKVKAKEYWKKYLQLAPKDDIDRKKAERYLNKL